MYKKCHSQVNPIAAVNAQKSGDKKDKTVELDIHAAWDIGMQNTSASDTWIVMIISTVSTENKASVHFLLGEHE